MPSEMRCKILKMLAQTDQRSNSHSHSHIVYVMDGGPQRTIHSLGLLDGKCSGWTELVLCGGRSYSHTSQAGLSSKSIKS